MSAAIHALSIRTTVPAENLGKNLVKNWTIRGTVHVFAREDLPLFLYHNRTHYLRPVDQMVPDEYVTLERKKKFAGVIVEAIGNGIDEREALKELCFDYGMTQQECESIFNSWGGTIRYLAETGQICYKVQEKKAFTLCPSFTPMEEKEAGLEMARRYFLNYGPATVSDAAYYFGTTRKRVKEWLNELPVTSAVVGERECFWIERDVSDYPRIPDCVFLAGFDQLMLGYEKKESIFLPLEYLRGIFTLAGIVMPGILLKGQVVGRWKRKNDRLTLTPFRSLTEPEKKIILRTVEQQWNVTKRVIWEE